MIVAFASRLNIKLLTQQHLEFFLALKEAAHACLSLFMSKCHIVGNLMSRLIYLWFTVLLACVLTRLDKL